MLKLFLFLIFCLATFNIANSQQSTRVLSSGFSTNFVAFSFIDGILDPAKEIEAEKNLTFATFDEVFDLTP